MMAAIFPSVSLQGFWLPVFKCTYQHRNGFTSACLRSSGYLETSGFVGEAAAHFCVILLHPRTQIRTRGQRSARFATSKRATKASTSDRRQPST